MKITLKCVLLFLVFISIMIILGLFGYVQMLENSYQQNFLTQVKNLGKQKIIWGEISHVNRLEGNVEKKILRQNEITFIQNLLKNADIAPVGGHNRVMYECSLTFTVEGGTTVHLLGIVFSEYTWNKHDLYLYENQEIRRPIRIKYLGKWIIENVSKK